MAFGIAALAMGVQPALLALHKMYIITATTHTIEPVDTLAVGHSFWVFEALLLGTWIPLHQPCAQACGLAVSIGTALRCLVICSPPAVGSNMVLLR